MFIVCPNSYQIDRHSMSKLQTAMFHGNVHYCDNLEKIKSRGELYKCRHLVYKGFPLSYPFVHAPCSRRPNPSNPSSAMADDHYSSKRKYDDPSPPPRRTGFSSGPPPASPLAGGAPSYNSVPPPPDEIQLAKQRAQEIAARIFNAAEAKRPRVDNGDDDSGGFGVGLGSTGGGGRIGGGGLGFSSSAGGGEWQDLLLLIPFLVA
jgi:hypothetical protein